MSDLFMKTDALISPCGLYRYWLRRTWDEALPPLVWLMLNPSTADATDDDPTIRRCIGFAKRWFCGGIRVVNLYALRATDPKALWLAADPVGPDNDRHLIEQCAGQRVVAAWGANAPLARAVAVTDLIHGNAVVVYCLGTTAGNAPRHPLYVKGDAVPTQYPPRRP